MSEFDSRLTQEDFGKLNNVIREAERDGLKLLIVECGTDDAGRKVCDHLLMVYKTSGMIEEGLLVKRETRAFYKTGDFAAKTRYRVKFSLKDER